MNEERLLHKYLNGTANEVEINHLKANPKYAAYLNIAVASKGLTTPPFEQDKHYQAILLQKGQNPTLRKMNRAKWVIRSAAAALLLFLGYWFVTSFDTHVQTDIAQKELIRLPDGSQVHLNAKSEISYRKFNWDNERTLVLDGEAYFKVEKGSSFSVQTNRGLVQVLGTEFNVYSRHNNLLVHCYEGLVQVLLQNKTIELPAGSTLNFTAKNELEQNTTTDVSPNWIAHESTFENVSLSLVLEELQRQYPIKIISQNIVDKNFTGSFTHNNLEVALRSICDPLQFDFTIEGEDVRLYARKNN
ncbi:MAG: FecR domain-containing protein [Bacteroidia bacterium]|nr:FecR domain-containing protein [Bacteroidia bacterium]